MMLFYNAVQLEEIELVEVLTVLRAKEQYNGYCCSELRIKIDGWGYDYGNRILENLICFVRSREEGYVLPLTSSDRTICFDVMVIGEYLS